MFRNRGRFALKGFSERWRLFEVLAQPNGSGARAAEIGRGPRWRRSPLLLALASTGLLAAAVAVAATQVLGGGNNAGRADGPDAEAGPASPVEDAPTILPGRSIGGIRLGMSEDEAVEHYGEPELRQDRTSGGKTFALLSYDLHDGRFRIATLDGKVVSVSTMSPYYQLENGTGVGEISPNPSLDDVVDERDGRYFWNEYEYQDFGGGCNMWVARGFGGVTELVLSSHGSGRIAGVRVIDRDHAADVPREIGRCR
jgi:hypothetical protein